MSRVSRSAAALAALAAALVMAMMSPGVAGAGLTGGPHTDGTIVSTFEPGSFPESVALADGIPFVSLGFAGEIRRVTNGSTMVVGTVDLGGSSLLTGVTVVGDRLYFARASFDGDGWLYSLPVAAENATPTLVTTFPDSFPNGLAVRDGLLYVSDSRGGRVFTVDPVSGETATWCQDPALAGGKALGINGITFHNGQLYAVVAATGEIMTIAGGADGCTVSTVVRSNQLVTGDGIAFGPDGLLYVTVNQSNKLVAVDVATGALRTIAGRTNGLSYPTQTVFGTGVMYLTNGALANGAATLMRFPLDSASR
jgi:sugar lactone lactonase YvrE